MDALRDASECRAQRASRFLPLAEVLATGMPFGNARRILSNVSRARSRDVGRGLDWPLARGELLSLRVEAEGEVQAGR